MTYRRSSYASVRGSHTSVPAPAPSAPAVENYALASVVEALGFPVSYVGALHAYMPQVEEHMECEQSYQAREHFYMHPLRPIYYSFSNNPPMCRSCRSDPYEPKLAAPALETPAARAETLLELELLSAQTDAPSTLTKAEIRAAQVHEYMDRLDKELSFPEALRSSA